MSSPEQPSFDELVDLLRERLGYADALDQQTHSFKELMKDPAEVIADNWYWEAFDELEAQAHLDMGVSNRLNGGDADGRLSADGRLYLRSTAD